MSTENVRAVEYDVQDGIAVITLNRPKEYNAINDVLASQLRESFALASADDQVVAVILTGRGRAFCAGVDLKAAASGSKVLSANNMGTEDSLATCITACKKPVIGAINGFAVTGGLELAIACDFLYAGESVRFADTHAIVGLVPGWGLSQKLPRLIGVNRAQEMSYTGMYIDAAKALEWGLINKVCKDDALMDDAMKTAAMIKDAQPGALQTHKELINAGWLLGLEAGLEMETAVSKKFNGEADMSVMDERLAVLRARAKAGRRPE